MPALWRMWKVDDETGEVKVLGMNSAYELGRVINPKMVEQQLVGGAWMGISHALYETPEPYYPNPDHGPARLQRISDAGPGDIAPYAISILERPAPDGPSAARGRARCARTPCCRPSPTRSTMPWACG